MQIEKKTKILIAETKQMSTTRRVCFFQNGVGCSSTAYRVRSDFTRFNHSFFLYFNAYAVHLSAHHVRMEEVVRVDEAEFLFRHGRASLHLELEVVAVEVTLVVLSVRTLHMKGK